MEPLFITQMFSCFFMTGLIWVIQLVHYPSFKFVDIRNTKEFNSFHQTKITIIVMPIMLIELITAIILTIQSSFEFMFVLNTSLLLIIWLSTFLLSIPIHSKLVTNHSDDLIEKLVLTNWPRTILWSFRSLIFFFMIIN